jgi:hypothetical protein
MIRLIGRHAVGKCTVKLSVCLNRYHATTTDGGVEVQFHIFLTSAVEGSDWLVSHPGYFSFIE